MSTPSPPATQKMEEIPASFIEMIVATFGKDAELYELLDVKKEASFREIRIAYFRCGRQVLTDTQIVGGHQSSSTVESVSEQAKMRFQAVSMAYEILSSSEMREIYDNQGLDDHAVTDDDDYMDYYARSDTRSTPKPKANSFDVMNAPEPLVKVRSAVTWNEEVEELLFEKDHNDSEKGKRNGRREKNRRNRNRPMKNKVVLDTDELESHLQQIDKEAQNSIGGKDVVDDFLDDLEASIDGVLSWDSNNAKGNTESEREQVVAEHHSIGVNNESDHRNVAIPPPQEDEYNDSTPPQKSLDEKHQNKAAAAAPTRTYDQYTSFERGNRDPNVEGFTIDTYANDTMETMSALSINTYDGGGSSGNRYSKAPINSPFDEEEEHPDDELNFVVGQSARVPSVEKPDYDILSDTTPLRKTAEGTTVADTSGVVTPDGNGCVKNDEGKGKSTTTKVGGNSKGNITDAAEWLLMGDTTAASREIAATLDTEKEGMASDLGYMTDFASYLYQYLKTFTDEVSTCAASLSNVDIDMLQAPSQAINSLTLSDDDMSSMLNILKVEMDRTPHDL